jgi:two-component system NtrC family sensor kinase
MAALGSLVAGVAYEINTPLGVALLSGSTIEDAVSTLTEKVDNNTLAKSELVSSLNLIRSSEQALSFNLQRAENLVANFKEMAVDINTDELTEINVKLWLDSLMGSLQPMLKKKNISVVLNTEKVVETLTTFPSKLSQVITNIVSNCATDAFLIDDQKANKITIDVTFVEDKLCLAISDNGLGMNDETQKHLFDPFYTTKRGEGGTDLGLNIIENIVRTNLKGICELIQL